MAFGDLVGVGEVPISTLNRDIEGEYFIQKPADFTLSEDGFLYVLDTGDGHILKLDLQGQVLQKISQKGHGPREGRHGDERGSGVDG